jgi:hypothetical protein
MISPLTPFRGKKRWPEDHLAYTRQVGYRLTLDAGTPSGGSLCLTNTELSLSVSRRD